jgi:hypothetical protein
MIRRTGISPRSTLTTVLVAFSAVLLAGDGLPECGSKSADPFAPPTDQGGRRCGQPVPRQYKAQFTGLAYRLLEDESEACFVPDSAFELLVAYRDAGRLYPEAPWAWNGLAWLISTRAVPDRDKLKGEALTAARRA